MNFSDTVTVRSTHDTCTVCVHAFCSHSTLSFFFFLPLGAVPVHIRVTLYVCVAESVVGERKRNVMEGNV